MELKKLLNYECTRETILTGLGAAFLTYGLINYNNNDSEYPTAMDVYQGKTILKITHEDGVAVDSVVVFKTIKD